MIAHLKPLVIDLEAPSYNVQAALNLITLLKKCKCELCQKELKKLLDKYGFED